MALLKDTVVEGTITGNLTGNADTATNYKMQIIPNSTDLYTITTAGHYICESAENAQTLTNCPTTQPFYMSVDVISENFIKQTIQTTTAENTPVIFMNTKIAGSFGAWSRLTGVAIS